MFTISAMATAFLIITDISPVQKKSYRTKDETKKHQNISDLLSFVKIHRSKLVKLSTIKVLLSKKAKQFFTRAMEWYKQKCKSYIASESHVGFKKRFIFIILSPAMICRTVGNERKSFSRALLFKRSNQTLILYAFFFFSFHTFFFR